MYVQRPFQHSGILSHNGNQHKTKLLVTHAMGRIFTFPHLYNFEKVLAQFLSTERVCKWWYVMSKVCTRLQVRLLLSDNYIKSWQGPPKVHATCDTLSSCIYYYSLQALSSSLYVGLSFTAYYCGWKHTPVYKSYYTKMMRNCKSHDCIFCHNCTTHYKPSLNHFPML